MQYMFTFYVLSVLFYSSSVTFVCPHMLINCVALQNMTSHSLCCLHWVEGCDWEGCEHPQVGDRLVPACWLLSVPCCCLPCTLLHNCYVICHLLWASRCDRLFRHINLFLEAVHRDDDFADSLAHSLNKWCAILQMVLYNLAAVLIFTVNHHLYGRLW